MRKWRTLACLLILALTIPAAWHMRRQLPPDTQPMIEKKYGSWSGVLRLWVREELPVGSASAASWLNRCIATFEKRHPGVYVQPEYVDAGALAAEGISLPDLMLFPPGTVDADLFAPLDQNLPLRAGLPRDERASPVMLGGYLWARNAGLIDGVPNSWRDLGLPVAVPPDDTDHLWIAALLALCSSRYSEDTSIPQSAPGSDLELGLSSDIDTPSPTPAPTIGTLSCLLPEDFEPDTDAWHAFINGDAAAMPVTPREIRRLKALSDQGKGPDWQLSSAGDMAFTDQVLYIGAIDQANVEKLALCRDFIAHLLSPECQGELHRVGAFPVTDADSGYAQGDNLRAMAESLIQRPLIVPAPFDTDWRRDAADIVRDFWRGSAEPADILSRLAERIRQ